VNEQPTTVYIDIIYVVDDLATQATDQTAVDMDKDSKKPQEASILDTTNPHLRDLRLAIEFKYLMGHAPGGLFDNHYMIVTPITIKK
jgi:hypothetical protein